MRPVLLAAVLLVGVQAIADEVVVPPGTRLFLTTDEVVSSKRGESEVGQLVPCRVWRDVVAGSTVVIRGDTVATCRIEKVRRRNIGGFEGKLSLAGVATTASDGQTVTLQGGYNKEGSGRKAIAWTLGLLFVWPALLVPGGAAELPPGTVFDVSTVNTLRLQSRQASGAPPRLDLSALSAAFEAEILLDEFLAQEKPEVLRVRVISDVALPASFVIDSVNGRMVAPLPLEAVDQSEATGETARILETRVKPLAKHFQKGINRFEVASEVDGAREAVEVILDVQM